MKWQNFLAVSACFLLISSAAMAETVAFFAPNLDFKDGAERNAYVSKVARALSDATGTTWQAQAFARAADFENARANVDVAILDADYFSGKGASLRPVAMLSANGQTMRPMKVISGKGKSDKLYSYRDKRLALVSNTSMAPAFFTATALDNEIKAAEYFSSIDDVRDVRSALNAVEVGKADLALVYDGYDSGFTTIYTTQPVALPVVAINAARMTGDKAEKVKKTLLNLNVRGASFITGTAAYNAQDAGAYRRLALARKKSALKYLPVEPDTQAVAFRSAPISPRSTGIEMNPFQVQYVPPLRTLDKILERNL